MCSSRKYPYSHHRRDWNFQRGGEVLGKNPFRGGGMQIFWNYTMLK